MITVGVTIAETLSPSPLSPGMSLATKLVNELVEAADDKQLTKTIARYGRVDLLCIDELGYMELDKRGAELLFQVLTEREEKNSVAIASNDRWVDENLHRCPALRRDRRSTHLRRQHHRDRHRFLPARSHQSRHGHQTEMTNRPDPAELDPIELGELLLLVHDWISADQAARISFNQFLTTGTYTADDLRSDLLRHIVLLGIDIG